MSELNWKNYDNPKDQRIILPIGNASVFIIESEYYLDNQKDINQFSWWLFGYAAGSDQIAHIRGIDYSIYVDFVDNGYVQIDDWKTVDPNILINELRNIAKSNEEYFKKNNLNYAVAIDWIFEPELNLDTNVVSYSYKVKWNTGNFTMEAKTIKLGKKGYFESAYIADYNDKLDLASVADNSKAFADTINFDEGYRYADYKSGDKVAAVGIGSLVAGTLGVKALAKAGVFAKFIPMLLKFGWLLLIPLAFVGKLFDTKPKSRKSKKQK